MTNPDRAEFSLQLTSVPENHSKNSHIPSWARASVFAARTFLAVLTSTPGMVVAADAITRIQNPSIVYAAGDNCENTELHFISISFADDPMAKYDNSNVYTSRDGLDPGDIWMGSPQFGQVVIQYSERIRDPNWEEVGRFNMVNNGTYSLARIRLAGLNPNEAVIGTAYNQLSGITSPSLVVQFYFDDNREMTGKTIIGYMFNSKDHKIQQTTHRFIQGKIGWILIPCGDTFLFSVGELTTDEDIQKAVNNPNFVFKRWRDIIDNFIRSEFPGFSFDDSWNKFSNNYPPFSQNNYPPLSQEDTRQAFQKYLDNQKKKAALPTTSRPSSTITPMPTPTRTSAEATATADTIRLTAMNTEMAKIMATATAEAKPSVTPTPRSVIPEIVPTLVVPIDRSTSTTGIPDWLWGLGAASLAGLAAYWGYGRGKQKNPPPPPPPFPPSPPSSGSGGSNPNTGPATAPNFGPVQTKNPEWVIGQKAFERRWQAAKSKLSLVLPGDQGDEAGYILDRFTAGMNVVHEVSLDVATDVIEMDTRVRAGIEYLIPEIWPNSEIPKNFFDPEFFTPEVLARSIFIPEPYRNLSSFTKSQRRDINRIHRVLLHALHPDVLRIEADPKLKDSIDTLLIQVNSAWPLINKLLS